MYIYVWLYHQIHHHIADPSLIMTYYQMRVAMSYIALSYSILFPITFHIYIYMIVTPNASSHSRSVLDYDTTSWYKPGESGYERYRRVCLHELLFDRRTRLALWMYAYICMCVCAWEFICVYMWFHFSLIARSDLPYECMYTYACECACVFMRVCVCLHGLLFDRRTRLVLYIYM